jgi:hypothetical protein
MAEIVECAVRNLICYAQSSFTAPRISLYINATNQPGD